MIKHRLENGILHVEIPGDILSTSVEALRDRIRELLEAPAVVKAHWRTLELDLTAAKMIDSMGLNLLVAILKLVRDQGGRMRIALRDNNLDRLLRFTRINEHVDIVRA